MDSLTPPITTVYCVRILCSQRRFKGPHSASRNVWYRLVNQREFSPSLWVVLFGLIWHLHKATRKGEQRGEQWGIDSQRCERVAGNGRNTGRWGQKKEKKPRNERLPEDRNQQNSGSKQGTTRKRGTACCNMVTEEWVWVRNGKNGWRQNWMRCTQRRQLASLKTSNPRLNCV